MDVQAWQPTIDAIRASFGYSESKDGASAIAFADYLRACGQGTHGAELEAALAGRTVHVVGCGPSLAALRPASLSDPMPGLPEHGLRPEPILAADGATQRLQELGIVPDVVVTDLDGAPDALAWASNNGARMVVHAHGDNATRIQTVAPRLAIALGTHQVAHTPDLDPLQNPGGFTDGDRAVLLAEHFGAAAVLLHAFEPQAPPSRYSHAFDPATKMRKLDWAQKILADAEARGVKIAWC